MNVPKNTQEIFERLSRGNFLCENSPDREEERLFNSCERYYKELFDYFSYIGYDLILEDGFCYFSKRLTNTQIDNKLEKIMDQIDYLKVMLSYSENFGVGWRGSAVELAVAAKDNSVLKNEIQRLRFPASLTLKQRCEKVFDELKESGFMALDNAYEGRYIVLNSYRYLEKFFQNIEVDNDELS